MFKTNILSAFFQMLAREFKDSEGYNKFLILALIVNIPVLGFVPYVTQAITIVLVALFLKQYRKVVVAGQENQKRVMLTSGATLLVQLVWTPYATQLITLILLGILYNLVQNKE